MSDQQDGDGGDGQPGAPEGAAEPSRRYGAERFAAAPPEPRADGTPGYGAPAYGPPGYGAPGPGYGPPAYGAPGYGVPGYGPPGAALPEGVEYASYGRRVLAGVVDTLLLGVCIIPGIVVTALAWAAVAPEPDLPPALGILIAVVIIAGIGAWLFNVCWTQGVTGQSWGKRATGIHLVREHPLTPPGGGTGVARYLVRSAIGNATCGVYSLVTILWPLWDDRNQTIDDKIVHTLVVRFTP
jgi:uncharacterized RDD family membrane protein YckC